MSAPTTNHLTRRQLLWASATCLGLSGLSLDALSASPVGPPLGTLRIGFQKSSVYLVVLKQSGTLEKLWPQTRVQWIEFPAGPQLLEALALDSVDFGFTGDSPPVFAQAAGKEIIYVGAELAKPQSSAILVKPDAPIHTLSDLKGKKIAFQKGSSAHYLTVRALEKGRVNWSDITPIHLGPAEARAAFDRGSVDAWAIWDPYYAAAEVDDKPRVLSNGEGLSNNNSFYLASRRLVDKHPDLILALLGALTQTDTFVQGHRKEAAQLISDFSGLGLATVHRFLTRRPASPVRPLWAAVIADQQAVADAFFKQGLIPKQIRVADVVWRATS